MASKQGKAISQEMRNRIIEMYLSGKSYSEIGKTLGISKPGCFRIVKRYEEHNTLIPKIKTKSRGNRKVTDQVLQFIAYSKWRKPSIFSREIKQKLLDEKLCTTSNVPSVKRISYVVKHVLDLSYKKLCSIPAETLRPNHDQIVNNYFASLLNYDYTQMHFFDEASIVSTAGNRGYGHSLVGTRAVEVQRYASSTTLTVNVCCDFFGLNHYNIINGASNAFEMINFFNEAMQERNAIGNPMFCRGDVIIMDNCGFHHHRQGERLLRDLLATHGINLIFQPPYSPEFNVTECVFGMMRQHLQANEAFVSQYLELAVVNALDNDIMKRYMPSFFKKCGYL
ncbi:hypothetical protein FSP39_006274 [Pinctada imbricata]|uniref:Paired domain-containing protein n=1 Tax=Pinctada imbricata TaxID=66713 RepID=A0AA88XI05_PINIB|nr:hypothetical protein FSP39_006274 [Pinctada imbricata]